LLLQPATSRYTELAASTVRSGDAVLEANSDDEDLMNTGELDVDMAEPTLADRLKAMNVNKAAMLTNGVVGEEGEGDVAEEDEEEDDEIINTGPSVPSATLTTTLIQALHSADAPLLESCLSHTSPTLIRATVKRLSSGSLVLTLLEALVDRLGKGKKGRQGNASVKRSRGLIEWVRQTLIVHVGFLVTVRRFLLFLPSYLLY
jgi:U3 small nucleolar RNA-associated protein 5